MTATSRVSNQIRVGFVLVSLATMSGTTLVAQDTKQESAQHKRQSRCFSDEGTIRACLVPEEQLEGRKNIQIGTSGCYWLKEDEKEKKKQYKRSANGRPRQFAFQVVNLCKDSVDVRLDLAIEGTLRFQTARCESEGGVEKGSGYIAIPLGPVPYGKEAVATCDSRPYPGKWLFGKSLHRTFRLAVTAYGNEKLASEIYFDPEVVLEKTGEH